MVIKVKITGNLPTTTKKKKRAKEAVIRGVN